MVTILSLFFKYGDRKTQILLFGKKIKKSTRGKILPKRKTLIPCWPWNSIFRIYKYNMFVKICDQELIDIIWVHHFPVTLWSHTSLHRKYPIATFHHAHHERTIAQLIPKINIFFEIFSIYSNWWSSAGSGREVKIIHKKI
jgi:hypothetical protein